MLHNEHCKVVEATRPISLLKKMNVTNNTILIVHAKVVKVQFSGL
jgi:hypothetical protein